MLAKVSKQLSQLDLTPGCTVQNALQHEVRGNTRPVRFVVAAERQLPRSLQAIEARASQAWRHFTYSTYFRYS